MMEPGDRTWQKMQDAVDVVIKEVETDIFETQLSFEKSDLLFKLLRYFWEEAFEDGRFNMHNELQREGLLGR